MAAPQDDLLKIGAFARLAGTNLRTLRYYEEVGLLEPTRRSQGGFRYYRREDVERVRWIRFLKELGMTLEDVRGLIACRTDTSERTQWVARMDQALAAIDGHIETGIARLRQRQAQAREARAKLVECRPCPHRPAPSNNYCHPCQCSGTPLPELLRALF